MKNLKLSFIPILLFFINLQFSIAQSKIYVGGGGIILNIKISDKPLNESSIIPVSGYSYPNLAANFNYEYHFNDHFFISANANFSQFQIEYYLPRSVSNSYRSNYVNFDQTSVSCLINCKILNKKLAGSLNYGTGLNTNYFFNFNSNPDTQNISTTKIHELGFAQHLSLNLKNYRVSIQQTIGRKMYGGNKLNLKVTASILLTVGYVF